MGQSKNIKKDMIQRHRKKVPIIKRNKQQVMGKTLQKSPSPINDYKGGRDIHYSVVE